MSVILRNVTCRFGRLAAVRNVSLHAPAAGVLGLVGPIGAGKSTLLRVMSGLLIPDSGSAIVWGHESHRDADAIRRRVGFVPQGLPGCSDARVREVLTFRAALKDVPGRRRSQEVDRVIAECGLRDVQNRLIGRLSHGFQRQVCLAEALLAEPGLLLLDEPVSGLDAATADRTTELIRKLGTERLVVLSTHHLSGLDRLCHRVVLLIRGEIADDISVNPAASHQTVAELQATSDDVREWIESASLPGKVVATDGGVRLTLDGDCRSRIGEVSIRRGWPLQELRLLGTSLEEHLVRRMVQSRVA